MQKVLTQHFLVLKTFSSSKVTEICSSLETLMDTCVELDRASHGSVANSASSSSGSSASAKNRSQESSKWCSYHQSSSHDTSECRSKKQDSSPSSSSGGSAPAKSDQPLKTKDGTLVKCKICSGNHYPDKCPNKDSADRANGVTTRSKAAAQAAPPAAGNPAPVQVKSLLADAIRSPVGGKKYVFLYVAGSMYSCLLDCGANLSCIDQALATALGLHVHAPPVPTSVKLAFSNVVVPRIGHSFIPRVEFVFPHSDKEKYVLENYAFEVGTLRDPTSDDPHFILGVDLVNKLFPGALPEEYMIPPASSANARVASLAVDCSVPAPLSPSESKDASAEPSRSVSVSSQTAVTTPEELELLYSSQRDSLVISLSDCIEVNTRITGFCNLPESKVTLQLAPDVDLSSLYRRQYPIAHRMRELASPIIYRWFDSERIELAAPGCRYNNAMTVVPKKDDQGLLTGARPCLDSRFLNKVLIWRDGFQLPRIRDSFDILAGCAIFGTVDAFDAYLQFQLDEASRPLTAFTWENRQYQFVGCPFGLAPLTSHFQRCMSLIFSDMPFVMIYVDNIVWGSHTWDEHAAHARAVIERLTSYNIRIKPSSIKLGHAQLQCLGHIINVRGVATDPAKIRSIVEWPQPQTPKELQSFLGFCCFLREHIRHFADITAPLESVKTLPVLDWTPLLEDSFKTLKDAFSRASVLSFPDFSRPFHIATDASQTGAGGVLFQPLLEGEHITPTNIVAICSQKFDETKQRWPAYKKELWAIVYCLRQFHCYVYGRSDLVIHTDHKPLTHMFESTTLSPALQQWLDVLLDYTFAIVHRDGILNVLPDALSRMYGAAYSQSPIWGAQAVFPTAPLEEISVRSAGFRSSPLGEGAVDSVQDSSQRPSALSSTELEVELERRGKKAPSSSEDKLALIQSTHALGHFGVEATFRKLYQQGWWWPNMRTEILSQLKECDACIRYTVVKTGFHPARAITALGPWDHVQVDCLVHLPLSPDGLNTLFVAVDVFQGFCLLKASKDSTAESMALFLWECCSVFGLFKILQTDNGPEFSNDVIRALAKLTGIEHRFISAYNPRADGKVERLIGSISMIIKKMLHGTSNHWPLFVSFAQFSYNQKISSLTGSSPFALMFGRESNPIRDYTSLPEGELIPVDLEEWKEHQRKILSLVYPAISERIKSGKDKMIAGLDRTRKLLLPSSLPGGSTVMLLDPKRTNKFEPKYIGPYTVIRRSRNGAYLLKDATGMPLDRHVPIDQLKIVIKGKQRRQIDQDQEVFEVETILEHRGVPGAYEYRVHWKGYSTEEDSWEPASSFLDDKVIQQYWKLNKASDVSALRQ